MIKKERIAYFDNLKAILIFLVVLGHMIEPYIKHSSLARWIFIYIYIFHMPSFIFISGYFSKPNKKGWIKKSILKFLIPYILIQIIFIEFTKIIGLHTYHFTIITPVYVYWYLFAIFIWNIGLKILTMINIKLKYLIILATISGLLVGYLDKFDGIFSISRIIVFSPFFLFGYYCKKNNINCNNIIKKRNAILILILILGVSMMLLTINTNLLLENTPYKYLGLDGYGVIYRGILYLIQFITTFSFFSIISNKEKRYTYIGENTLCIYMLHAFIVKFIVSMGYYKHYTIVKLIAIIILSMITVCFLGNLEINKLKIYRKH